MMEVDIQNENEHDSYYVKWDDNFIDNIDIDQRGTIEKRMHIWEEIVSLECTNLQNLPSFV